jgi:hypothetical protein
MAWLGALVLHVLLLSSQGRTDCIYWDKDGRLSRAREGRSSMLTDRGCRLREPEPRMVCGPWPPEKRAWLRESLEVMPLRGTVCEECMQSWFANLPKGPDWSVNRPTAGPPEVGNPPGRY